jgi:hypothetical protein
VEDEGKKCAAGRRREKSEKNEALNEDLIN